SRRHPAAPCTQSAAVSWLLPRWRWFPFGQPCFSRPPPISTAQKSWPRAQLWESPTGRRCTAYVSAMIRWLFGT
ncbi:hypothetical protein LPJ57_010549, partial [Coemansia sp. RSA 486]